MNCAHIARLVTTGALAIGLGGGLASCQPKAPETESPQTSSPRVDSDAVVTPSDTLDRGSMTYLGYCGVCHGAEGRGDGPLAEAFIQQGARRPALLADSARLERLGRDGILDAIAKGGRHTGSSYLMPPWGELLDRTLAGEVADHVLTFPNARSDSATEAIRKYLTPPPGISAGWRERFVFYCTACHGAQGKGDGSLADALWAAHQVRPRDLTDSSYFAQKSDAELLGTLSLGGGHTGRSTFMPAWNHTFPPAQLRDLIGYVRAISHTQKP